MRLQIMRVPVKLLGAFDFTSADQKIGLDQFEVFKLWPLYFEETILLSSGFIVSNERSAVQLSPFGL